MHFLCCQSKNMCAKLNLSLLLLLITDSISDANVSDFSEPDVAADCSPIIRDGFVFDQQLS